MALDHVITLQIPFEHGSHASIAQKAISADPVLNKDDIAVRFSATGRVLNCFFAGASDRVLRVAVSNCIDNLKTIIETIDEFDGQRQTIFA